MVVKMKPVKNDSKSKAPKNKNIKPSAENSVLTLLNAISDCACLLDKSGNIEWANSPACKLLGGKNTVPAGQKIFELLPAETKDIFKQNFNKAVKSKKPVRFETQQKNKWNEINLNPVKDGNDKVLQIAVYSKDITGSKHTKEAFENNQSILKAQLENSPDLIMVIDRKLKYVSINKSFSNTINIKNLIGKNAIEPLPEKERTRVRKIINECFKTGNIQVFEHEFEDNQWILARIVPMPSAGGTIQQVMIISTDITERKLNEKALHESEERFQSLFERAPLGYQSLDFDGKFVEVNQAWCETLGYSSKDVTGKWFGDFLAPEYVDAFRERFPVFKMQGYIHSEFYMIHKNGDRRYIAFDGRIGYNPDGSFKQTHCILRDDTERKAAEDALQKSEARFRAIVENIHDAISFTDADATVQYRSPSYSTINGFTNAERQGRNGFELIHPDDMNNVRLTWQKILKHPETIQTSAFRVKHKDGTWRYIEATAQNLLSNPDINAILQISRDITERRQSEMQLKESNDLLSEYIKQSPVYAFIKSVKPGESRVIYASENYKDMIGISGSDMVGKTMGELFPAKFAEKITRDDWDVVAAGKVLTVDETLNNKYYITIKFPIKQESRSLLAGYTIDITERKLAEEKLRESEAKFSIMFDSIPIDIGLTTHPDGKFYDVNSTWLKSNGFKRKEEVIGKTAEELGLVPEEEQRKIIKKEFLKHGSVRGREIMIRTKSGENRFVRTSLDIIKINNRDFLLSSAEDITQRKLAEETLRESEAKFSIMFEATPVGMALTSIADSKIQDVNTSWLRIYGYSSKEDVIGKTVVGLGIICDREKFAHDMKEFFRDGSLRDTEVTANSKSLGKRIIRISLEKIKINNLDYILATSKDITESKFAEEALHKSEEKYRTLFNTMTQGVVYQDASGKIISANPAAERILGVSTDQMMGLTSMDPRWKAIKEDGSDFPGDMHPIPVALRTGKEVNDVIHGIFHPGKNDYAWIKINAVPLFRNGKNKPYQAYATIEDITEQKKSEQNYRMLFREMLDGFALHEMIYNEHGEPVDYRFIAVNPAFERMTGLSAETITGRRVLDALPGTEEYWIKTYGNVALTGEPVQFENFHSELNKHFKVTAFRPAPDQFAVIFSDITERKFAEEALRVSEEKYRNIFESAPEGIFQSDKTGKFISINPSYANILGYDSPEELLSKITSIKEQLFVNSEDYENFITNINEHDKIENFEHQFYKKDGSKTWLSANIRAERGPDGKILYFEGVVEDISRRKHAEDEKNRLEAQLRQAQKMEALGTFVGGIAHDFNNILSVLIGYTTLMRMELETDSPLFSYVDQILPSSEKAASLTKSLLAFSRNQPLSHNPFNLNEKIKDIEKILRRIITEDISLNIKLCENDITVMGDTSQIDQLFFNLATNARDALPKGRHNKYFHKRYRS